MSAAEADDRLGFIEHLVGDGRSFLIVVALVLAFAGGAALLLAAAGEFLPHDIRYLGMSAEELCRIADCRVVAFMIHDRAAFGGTLVGMAIMYLWLTLFPLARGEQWAWWTWLLTGSLGFLSFLSYLGYGYLDTWHGVATILLLPCFLLGMLRTRRLVGELDPRRIVQPGNWLVPGQRATLGRLVLLAGAVATVSGGLAILRVGIGETFVPEDLGFIGLSADQLRATNPRLVPLLAHERAGFGGGVVTMGLTTLVCLWCGPRARHLDQAVALAGGISLSAALGVHFVVGYVDLWHLIPPLAALISLVVGLALSYPIAPAVLV